MGEKKQRSSRHAKGKHSTASCDASRKNQKAFCDRRSGRRSAKPNPIREPREDVARGRGSERETQRANGEAEEEQGDGVRDASASEEVPAGDAGDAAQAGEQHAVCRRRFRHRPSRSKRGASRSHAAAGFDRRRICGNGYVIQICWPVAVPGRNFLLSCEGEC